MCQSLSEGDDDDICDYDWNGVSALCGMCGVGGRVGGGGWFVAQHLFGVTCEEHCRVLAVAPDNVGKQQLDEEWRRHSAEVK